MLRSDLISGLIVLALTGVGFYQSQGFSYYGGVFVSWVLFVLGTLGICLVIKGLAGRENLHFWEKDAHRGKVLWTALLLTVYALTLQRLGFICASIFVFSGLCILLSPPAKRRTLRTWLYAFLTGSLITLLFFLIFKYALLVPLPLGSLFSK